MKATEERAPLPFRGVKPARKEGCGFRREVGEGPVSSDVGFGAGNENCRCSVLFEPHMFEIQDGELRASAECIVTCTYQRCVAETRECRRGRLGRRGF
jgi:hypothetical protein